jgi:hypothetical protein
MVVKFQGLMNKPNVLTREMGAPYGETPQYLILELHQIDKYVTFINKGHHTKVSPPVAYKKIGVHLIMMLNMTANKKSD